VCRDADRVAGLLEANNIYNTKLLVNRVRPDMIQKNDMMSVRDVQVGRAAGSSSSWHC
jgi:septum site-determining protein MinD